MFFFSLIFKALESKLVNQFCEDEHGALIYNRIGNGGSINGPSIHSSQYLLHTSSNTGQSVSSQGYETPMKENSINLEKLSQPLIPVHTGHWLFSEFLLLAANELSLMSLFRIFAVGHSILNLKGLTTDFCQFILFRPFLCCFSKTKLRIKVS